MLTVQCDSTAWATQLRLLAPQLVARLNEDLGQGTVRLIKVLGRGPRESAAAREQGPGTPTAEPCLPRPVRGHVHGTRGSGATHATA